MTQLVITSIKNGWFDGFIVSNVAINKPENVLLEPIRNLQASDLYMAERLGLLAFDNIPEAMEAKTEYNLYLANM